LFVQAYNIIWTTTWFCLYLTASQVSPVICIPGVVEF
jgi:hypothetical protein